MSLPSVPVSQPPEDKFREYLASRPTPQRFTDQQRDLVRHVFAKHSHFDAEALADELKAEGLSVSRATVYRTLTKLVEAGMLRRIELGDRTVYDHDYGYPSHDHLVCDRCNKMIEFQDPAIEEVIRSVCAQHGFNPSGDHSLIVRGVCAECNTARAARRRLDLI